MVDKVSYDKLWDQTISVAITRFSKLPKVSCRSDAKEEIWVHYSNLNRNSRDKYMQDSGARLDRHKVAACYMFAILKASPLRIEFTPKEGVLVTLNEQLAIEVGLSVLHAFLTAPIAADEIEEVSPEEIEKNNKIFGSGFELPKAINGEYRKNFAIELYFTRTEENYNVLSLSNTLFLLEDRMREKWEIANGTVSQT